MTIGFRVEALATVESTNDFCRSRALQGEAAGLVIRADEQTAGRGRRGRPWASPKGNLYCSILMRPDRGAQAAATLGFALVIALGRAVAQLSPASIRIEHKWPNDLLVDGCKVAGLLMEAKSGPGGALDWLVIGLGVNIVSHPDGTPYPATDLCQAGARAIAPGELLSIVLAEFSDLLVLWEAGGFAAIQPLWLARAVGIGEEIEVRLDHETVRGRFRSLDSTGALLLESPLKVVRRISAGDVFFPTAAPAQTIQPLST